MRLHSLFCTVFLCKGSHLGKGRVFLSYIKVSSKGNGEQHSTKITKSYFKSPETSNQRQWCLISHTADIQLLDSKHRSSIPRHTHIAENELVISGEIEDQAYISKGTM